MPRKENHDLYLLLCVVSFSNANENQNGNQPQKDTRQEIIVTRSSNPALNLGGKLDIDSKTIQAREHEEPGKWDDPMVWLTMALVIANFFLWQTTRTAANAARDSIKLAREEFNASHRPRLVVRRVQLRFDPEKNQCGINFVVANVGDSIATNLRGLINIKVIDAQQMRSFEYESMPKYEGNWTDLSKLIATTTASPDLKGGQRAFIFIQFDELTEDSMSIIRQGARVLYFYGVIDYQDQEGRRRDMAFFRTYQSLPNNFVSKDDPDYEYH